jgi:hypothetical protein
MKPKKEWTFPNVVLFAIATEAALILVQFGALTIYARMHDQVGFRFSSDFIRNTGFYIFLVGGFALYAVVMYRLMRNIQTRIIHKLMVFVAVGSAIELAFYLLIAGSYEGVFIYSILDKVIAGAFALILFNEATGNRRSPESYW